MSADNYVLVRKEKTHYLLMRLIRHRNVNAVEVFKEYSDNIT